MSREEFSGHSTLSITLLLPFDLPSCDWLFEIQRHTPMTKAIIFDLDSCLAAADEVGEQLFAPAFAAIRAANDGSVPEEKLRTAFAECWRVAFDAVADKFDFTEAMRVAGWKLFRQTKVTEPMYQSRSDCVRVGAGLVRV